MKIVICGSMKFAPEMVDTGKQLFEMGHEVELPRHTEKYAKGEKRAETSSESTQNKIEGDLIRDYYRKIEMADAVLIVNPDKGEVKNYIGGNSFLELAFGHVLNKKCYILNDIPGMVYGDEIRAMQPVCLGGDLRKIN